MYSAHSHLPSRSRASNLGPGLGRALVRGAAAVGLLCLAACSRADEPGRRIESLRAHYSVKLTGWVVAQTPAAAAAVPVEAVAQTAENEADGGLVAAPAAVSDVNLDFEVRHDGAEKLDGLTVEVTQADGMGKEKAHYRVWLDTAAIAPGSTAHLAYTLKEVPHVVGDVFTAALRRRIPRSEWSLYKEYPAPR